MHLSAVCSACRRVQGVNRVIVGGIETLNFLHPASKLCWLEYSAT